MEASHDSMNFKAMYVMSANVLPCRDFAMRRRACPDFYCHSSTFEDGLDQHDHGRLECVSEPLKRRGSEKYRLMYG